MSENNEHWVQLQNAITISEAEFEKKLTYISSGSLILSLTFIEKIINIEKSIGVWLLISGWGLLCLTLIVNLFSHLVAKKHIRSAQKDIYNELEFKEKVKKIEKNNNKIEALNVSTLIFLVLGILSIIIFVSINTLNKSF